AEGGYFVPDPEFHKKHQWNEIWVKSVEDFEYESEEKLIHPEGKMREKSYYESTDKYHITEE
ncbi:MAG: hypothetical protein R6V04_02795, partial [bacterium]